MKTPIHILTTLAFSYVLSGCDDKECVKKDCITGTYIMDIRVKMRPPIINYDFGRPDVIPYDHQIIHNEVMDTNQNTCCSVIFYPHDSSCFKNYTIKGKGISIVEISDKLFLKNIEYIDANNERITFDVPLNIMGDSLVYNKQNNSSIGYFSKSPESISSANNWPGACDLLYFSIENKPGKTLKGRWVFKDLTETRCSVEMSDGESYRYRTGEIAEFTLTKVE